ncbi:glutamyl-tRNA synthetase [Candidatus Endolissoclinum faulkneri L2]|uniref:Glutamate--tRNA ligase n=1 Tax=Candidatus Endolissoclinum faulkneri L2 TaxID=1193729 RepID=K7YR62_9PROT|nr:glutamate--tRNA ligase [Candidatus Endolissoclinum faulkneri]AFX99014.1 glutamyl-tRNA synthetase [Candidatus Endolissoclinum faulkneri L2]
MSVVTRFAPSPTGSLHIGGARTALFNFMFARHHGGRYLLRIEDTDKKRSNMKIVDDILNGLDWLGLKGDADPIFQHKQINRHVEVAHQLLQKDKAYYCYCSPNELKLMRENARAEGRQPRYDSSWRNRKLSLNAPQVGIKPVIRIKAPLSGETTIVDAVRGAVTVMNSQLDDMIILRADGTPTYMHSVVVDDHDIGVTHVIRGEDHLNNTFRQAIIYQAMGWKLPTFAHIPLIYGSDGSKLSKRHGALDISIYRKMGYLPEALNNYLLRLGWSYGNEEIISHDKAIELFNLSGIGRSPSRFDFAKLENINGHYIRKGDNNQLTDMVLANLRSDANNLDLKDSIKLRIYLGMNGLKTRARTINELSNNARFYAANLPLSFDEKARHLLDNCEADIFSRLAQKLTELSSFQESDIKDAICIFAKNNALKLNQVTQPLRAAVTGSVNSPSIFEILSILGKKESIRRIDAVFSIKRTRLPK